MKLIKLKKLHSTIKKQFKKDISKKFTFILLKIKILVRLQVLKLLKVMKNLAQQMNNILQKRKIEKALNLQKLRAKVDIRNSIMKVRKLLPTTLQEKDKLFNILTNEKQLQEHLKKLISTLLKMKTVKNQLEMLLQPNLNVVMKQKNILQKRKIEKVILSLKLKILQEIQNIQKKETKLRVSLLAIKTQQLPMSTKRKLKKKQSQNRKKDLSKKLIFIELSTKMVM